MTSWPKRLDQEGWPVTTDEPFDLATEDGLKPGPALIACSGSDIVLSKGASTKPNPYKQKGRYVIMLPGILSLRPKTKESDVKVPSCEEANGTGNIKTSEEDEEENGETDETIELTPPTVETTNTLSADGEVTGAKAKPTTTTLLATMEGLTTDNPVLKIPYPNGGCLIFQGQKVHDSSSRFMMLSFKKGDVLCKDAVSSVIVFGESQFVGPQKPDDVEVDEIAHYGGSERTVDGGLAVKGKKRTRPVVKAVRLTQPKSEPIKVASMHTSSPKEISPKDLLDVESDDDCDEYLESKHEVISQSQTSDTTRRQSQRSVSSKVSYAVDEEEEEDDDSDADDGDDSDETPSKTTQVRQRRPPAAPKHKVLDVEEIDPPSQSSSSRQRPSRRTTAAAAKKSVVLEDGNSDENDDHVGDDDGDVAEETRATRKKPTKQVSRQQPPSRKRGAKAISLVDGDDDGVEVVTQVKKQAKASNTVKKNLPVKRLTAKKPIDVDDSSDEEVSDSKAKPRSNANPSKRQVRKPNVKRKADAEGTGLAQSSKVTVAKKAKVTVESSTLDADAVKENEPPKKYASISSAMQSQEESASIDETPKSQANNNKTTSESHITKVMTPRRRRRRKADGAPDTSPTAIQPPKAVERKQSGRRDDDDSGAFDFSVDDIAILTTPEKRLKVKTRKR